MLSIIIIIIKHVLIKVTLSCQRHGRGTAVNAADVHTVTDGNLILKYADDTYLLIPATNIQTRAAELQSVEQWAETNNLKLNHKRPTKSLSPTAAARVNRHTRHHRNCQELSELPV